MPDNQVVSMGQKAYLAAMAEDVDSEILGQRIGYSYFVKQLEQLWKPKGTVVFIDLGNEFYLVKFSNNDVLFDGPWMVSDHILVVHQWQPNFFPEEAVIDKAVVGARIPNLPIEYYDKPFLDRIGNRIGRTVKIDTNIEEGRHEKFARLSVEVDLTKSLILKFRFRRRI